MRWPLRPIYWVFTWFYWVACVVQPLVPAPSKFNMAAFCCLCLTKTVRNFSLLFGKNEAPASIAGGRTYFRAPGSTDEESFDEMFRNSNFVKLGRPQGKLVAGRITHIVERDDDKTDLYVDFGWKFHAVFTRGKEKGR